MRLKSVLLAGGMVVAGVGAAAAADIYVPPPVAPAPMMPAPMPLTWSGAYVGIHGGYIWGDADADFGRAGASADIDGLIGGALAGYNFEFDRVMLGVEADFGLTNASGEGPYPLIDGDDTTVDYDMDWNAHLRARVGLPMGKFMPFVAGGLAFADLTAKTNSYSGSATFTGWTLGGGADVMFSDHFVGRAEILYDDYGSQDFDGATIDLTGTTVRAALIYHFRR
jgi:outer membrane immunogenic protein